jgi:hypothetical protein
MSETKMNAWAEIEFIPKGGRKRETVEISGIPFTYHWHDGSRQAQEHWCVCDHFANTYSFDEFRIVSYGSSPCKDV